MTVFKLVVLLAALPALLLFVGVMAFAVTVSLRHSRRGKG